eukprot:11315086-Alexandrium_andersonii.AAC.1
MDIHAHMRLNAAVLAAQAPELWLNRQDELSRIMAEAQTATEARAHPLDLRDIVGERLSARESRGRGHDDPVPRRVGDAVWPPPRRA